MTAVAAAVFSSSLVYFSRIYLYIFHAICLSYVAFPFWYIFYIGNQVENSTHCRHMHIHTYIYIVYITHIWSIFIMHEVEIMNNQIFLIQLFRSFLSFYDIISVDGACWALSKTISNWWNRMRSKVMCVRKFGLPFFFFVQPFQKKKIGVIFFSNSGINSYKIRIGSDTICLVF